MKIFFSLLFDSRTYPLNIFLEKGIAIGSLHMGPVKLLSYLELHLGMEFTAKSDIGRLFQYREQLKANSKHSFYQKSLKAEDLEVATTLLKWRDSLKLAGWNFKYDKSCPQRLKDIANAENDNLGSGIADRYRFIMSELSKKRTLPVNEIIIHEPKHLLPAYLKELLRLLEVSGVYINFKTFPEVLKGNKDLQLLSSFVLDRKTSKTKIDASGDGSIQILKFGDRLSAANGLASFIACDSSFKPVVINESGDASLSLSLHSNGMPSTGQTMQSPIQPYLQLLVLLPVWLWKPYSAQQVLDFFLCPLNIFPKGLREKWTGLFCKNPGICSQEWNEALENYIKKIDKEQDRQKYRDRLQFLLDQANTNNTIKTEYIKEYYGYFYSIFSKRLAAVSNDDLQQTALKTLCYAFKNFISVLDIVPEKELDYNGLQKLLSLVIGVTSEIPIEKEADSLHELSHPGCLVGDIDDLVWFDFNARENSGTIWDKWTAEELKWLASKEVFPDTAELKAARNFWEFTHWLHFVKQRLVLVTYSVINGEAANSHPFQSFLEACFGNLHKITIHVQQPSDMHLMNVKLRLTKIINTYPIPTFPSYWNFRDAKFLGPRQEESFNSINKLINFPYQWVLSYKAKLFRGNTYSFPALPMFYGTLSHHIFQELLMMPDILFVSKSHLKKRYNVAATKAIEEKGLLLQIPGEEHTLKIFEEYLFNKFLILLKHIKENDWKVHGCEVTASGIIGEEVFSGRCDVLLIRTRKKVLEKAIIDLKYSGNSIYHDMMNKGADLQLAIYSRIFHPKANYCPTSYFIIRDGILMTPCADAFKEGQILRQDHEFTATYSDLLNRMNNTIKWRRAELRKGVIEVGEEVCTEDLKIFENDPASFIIPEKSGGYKSSSRYNDYTTFINTQ